MLLSSDNVNAPSLELQVFGVDSKKACVRALNMPDDTSTRSDCRVITGKKTAHYSYVGQRDAGSHVVTTIRTKLALQYPNDSVPLYKQQVVGCPLFSFFGYSRIERENDLEIPGTVQEMLPEEKLNMFGAPLPDGESCEPFYKGHATVTDTYTQTSTSTSKPKSSIWLYVGPAIALGFIPLLFAVIVYFRRNKPARAASDNPQDLSNLHSIDDFSWKNVSVFVSS